MADTGTATTAAAPAEEDADREWAMEELMAKGETVYNANCASCHQADGKGIPGAFPAITGSPVANGPADAHVNTIYAGVQGTAMASFAAQLSDVDIAAVITYQRNALGNAVGDTVQPAAIKALR